MTCLRRVVTLSSRCSGQALIETAITLPLLLMLVLNAVNFGYFFLVSLNLSGAVRSGALYSIQGSDTPGSPTLPPVSASQKTVVNLIRGGVTGEPGDLASLASSTNSTVQICSASAGITISGATRVSNCVQYSGATTPTYPTASTDPESTTFVLNQVDVWYHFNPIIPGTAFNIVVLASPVCTLTAGTVSCDFHRQVAMRAMGG